MSRDKADEQRDIVQSWKPELGAIENLTPLSSLSCTYKIRTTKGVYSLKRVEALPDPIDFANTYRTLMNHGVPCPSLKDYWQKDDYTFLVFQFLEGKSLKPKGQNWNLAWQKAYHWLQFLTDFNQWIPKRDLEKKWLNRFDGFFKDHPEANQLWTQLKGLSPEGEPRIAHGDFAPQNFLMNRQQWFILDWEEMGSARPGFDAGWIMALNYQGSGPRTSQDDLEETLLGLGVPPSNLAWFTGLGLLRIYYRGLTLPLNGFVREITLVALENPIKRLTEKLSAIR